MFQSEWGIAVTVAGRPVSSALPLRAHRLWYMHVWEDGAVPLWNQYVVEVFLIEFFVPLYTLSI